MDDNVKSFLEKIQDLNDKKIEVFVPSMKKTVPCSPISFKQQKDLIATIADGPLGTLRFNKKLNELLINNTGVSDMLYSDRSAMALSIRSSSVGKSWKKDDKDVLLAPIIKRAEKVKYPTVKKITGDVTMEVAIPTLELENHVTQAIIDKLKTAKGDLSKEVGEMFTYEIVKYIKSLSFSGVEINFQDISIRDRVKIVDSLPLTTNKKVVDYIHEVKKSENEALYYDLDGEKTFFDIDVSFFDA